MPICAFTAGESVLAALKLIALHGPLLLFAAALAARLAAGNLDRLAAAILIYLSAAAVIPWCLPHLSFGWLLIASLVLGAVGAALSGEFLQGRLALGPPLAGWLTFALVTLALWVYKTGLPYIDHDPLTYQLHFAASWLREGRIFVVPTPFGDPAQAYGPAAASLYYVWLMAPVGGDLLAVTGAMPFYLLAVLAAAGLGRELGARPDRLWAAAIFATGVISYQSGTALTDVAVAATFASALAFSLRAAREPSRGAAALAALSAGLMLGVKISGLSLLPLLLPPMIWSGWKGGRRLGPGWAAGAAAGAAAGLPWYVRNLMLTGNPVFPIRLALPGLDLPGIYGREEMLGWVFHYTGWAAWWEQVNNNFSLRFLVLAAVAVALLWYQRRRPEPGAARPEPGALIYVLLLPLLIDRLIWSALPYQELRFWAPIMPVLMAVMAAGLSRRGWLLLAGFAVTGFTFSSVYNFADDPMRYLKALAPAVGIPAAAVAAYFGLAFGLRRRDGRSAPAWAVPAAGLLIAALAVAVLLPLHPDRSRQVMRYYENSGGWAAVPCDRPSTVAYTGANVPYPLFGPRLQNRVLYVSPGGDVNRAPHALWAALPVKPRFRTAEPALERLRLCPRRWLEGLRQAGVNYLLVMKVPKNELYNIDHDAEGWPTEKAWADSSPAVFRPRYQDSFSRLYAIAFEGGDISKLPTGCEDRPADAPTACLVSPDLCQKFFPQYHRLPPR